MDGSAGRMQIIFQLKQAQAVLSDDSDFDKKLNKVYTLCHIFEKEERMTKKRPECKKCGDTGVDKTGNNDLPCGCPAGRKAKFNVAGVEGLVTGEEVRKHFLNSSPEPIPLGRGTIRAEDLPGRN